MEGGGEGRVWKGKKKAEPTQIGRGGMNINKNRKSCRTFA